MIIAIKCTKCDWQGNAEVGRRKGGVPLSEQQCPKCGSQVERRPGRYNWGDEEAKIKGGSRDERSKPKRHRREV